MRTSALILSISSPRQGGARYEEGEAQDAARSRLVLPLRFLVREYPAAGTNPVMVLLVEALVDRPPAGALALERARVAQVLFYRPEVNRFRI